MQRTRNYMVGSESRWQFTVRGNRDSKATKLLLTKKSIESVKLRLRGVSQCAGMQGHVWATKVLGLKCLPRTLEHRFDCARHDRAAADPEEWKFWVAKVFVPSVITKEHETVRSDQQFPINFLTHLFGPAPHHYGSACRPASVIRMRVTSIARPPGDHALRRRELDGEPVAAHERLGRAIVRRGEQFERRLGLGPRRLEPVDRAPIALSGAPTCLSPSRLRAASRVVRRCARAPPRACVPGTAVAAISKRASAAASAKASMNDAR